MMDIKKSRAFRFIRNVCFNHLPGVYSLGVNIERSFKWREHSVKTGGNAYPDKTFYVVRNWFSTNGLMSYVLITIGHIKYAIDKGYVPIVDMKHYRNNYSEGVDASENTWDCFFIQPSEIICGIQKIDDISLAKNVILSPGQPLEYPVTYIEYYTKPELVEVWRKIFRTYIRLNPETMEFAETVYHKLLGSQDIPTLGVLCRGTDQVNLKLYDHAIQPSIHQAIQKVDEVLSEGKYKRVFLATEDQEILNAFQSKFGDLVVTNESIRYDWSKMKEKVSLTTIHENIESEGIKRGRDYLASLFCLSKCQGFIAGMTAGSLAAYYMSDGFDYEYIWNLGRYGIDDQ